MNFDVTFQESKHDFPVSFGEIQTAGDGGYDRGYEEGEKVGYTNGYEAGVTEGAEVGYAKGQQAEYDAFWDAYQENGNRTEYGMLFAGPGWTPEIFKPKYTIRPGSAGNHYMMFARTGIEVLDETVLDTSQATAFSMSFYNSSKLRSVTIDIRSLKAFADVFNYDGALKTVALKNVPEDCNFTGGFSGCNRLTDFTVTGTIGGTTFNLQWSNLLTAESAKNIILHLKNHSGTAEANTCTIRFHANVWTALDAEGNTAPHGGTWKEYVGNLGWQI